MTFKEAYNEYLKQLNAVREAFDKRVSYPAINYEQLNKMLIQAAKDEYDFNEAQASFIYQIAYDRFHASYSDMFGGMDELCQNFKDFAKIKA